MSDLSTIASIGVAARYAAQIRELLALGQAHRNARSAAEENGNPGADPRLLANDPRGTAVDLRV